MGLFSFGKKQPAQPAAAGADGAAPAQPAGPADAFVAQPDKARKFFDHGRTMAQTGNYEYALMLYAKGFRLDPSAMTAHEEFYKVAVSFIQQGGKPAGRDNLKEIDGPGPVDKFAAAEYAWARDLLNIDAAFRLLEATAKAGQFEFGTWVAPKVLDILRKQKKQSKSVWVKADALFQSVEAWQEAFASVEEAIRIDPTDTQLSSALKEITARNALKKGGYDKAETQQSGGFRSAMRDAAKQQQQQEANLIVASEETEARNLERARQDYADNPMSPEASQKLGVLLRKQATAESEEEAVTVFMAAYERLNEYRFKMMAGEIRVAQGRRFVNAAARKVEANPDDAAAKAHYEELRKSLLDLEGRELREKQRNYPTDRGIKAELGRIEFELGNYEDAMAAFQACKDEAKLRIMATHMLGKCFAAEGWHGEAIGEFREALQSLGLGEADRELPIKYDLMLSLIELAKSEKNGAYAREAAEICSAIVRRDISYRDIRSKRKEIDALSKDLPA
ncbi:MAG: tetratricopeptide repeat protein [Planctomycetota bacterium]